MGSPFLELKNVNKTFGKVHAIKNINIRVDSNEILGLLGDNGAGKTTLIKIISGIHEADSGDMILKGDTVSKWNAIAARNAGIETVYQDKALSDQQAVYSNIFMGREICNFLGYINIKKEREETQNLMKEMGFSSALLSPESVILTCSGGEREGVSISRAMYFKANLVILDEPTTALSLKETRKVLNFVSKIKERGSSCIFITHNIYHAYEVSERFVVLDRGEIAFTEMKRNICYDELCEKMMHLAEGSKHTV